MNPNNNRSNNGGGNQQNRLKAKLNQLFAEEVTPDDETLAHIHAAIEHQGANNQFSVLQTPAEYEGKPFNLLIDSESTHSFISPRCIRNLNLPEQQASHMNVELATGKITKSTTTMGKLKFLLNNQPKIANF